MRPHRLTALLASIVMTIWLVPRPAAAIDLRSWLAAAHPRPQHARVLVPEAGVFAQPVAVPYRRDLGYVYRPWYGTGAGVVSYNWGYFGARYRPVCVTHRGYHGDAYQWSFRRGP